MARKSEVNIEKSKVLKANSEISGDEDFEGDSEMNAIVERLIKEKSESKITYKERGYEEGLRWAKSAHYDDIRYVLEWNPRIPLANDTKISEYFSEIIEEDALMKLVYWDDQSSWNRHTVMALKNNVCWVNEYAGAFLDGWKEGVEHFWHEIQNYL